MKQSGDYYFNLIWELYNYTSSGGPESEAARGRGAPQSITRRRARARCVAPYVSNACTINYKNTRGRHIARGAASVCGSVAV